MRLDKFLKVSRLIKRRTVANEACDAGRVSINGKEYNDKEIALNQMHEAMAMICSTTKGNDIEKQLTSMFSLSDNK